MKLLNGQKPKCVAHDHRKTTTGIQSSKTALQSANRHCECRHSEISLRLAAAGREPKQICISLKRVCSIHMRRICQRRNSEQQERQLKRTPLMVFNILLYSLERSRLLLPPFKRISGMNALIRHNAVGERKSLTRVFISFKHINSNLQAFKYLSTLLQIPIRLCPIKIKLRSCSLCLLLLYPLLIIPDELAQYPGSNIIRRRRCHRRRNCAHIKFMVSGNIL